ncbi:DUF6350 family protein [Boudabousia liubingyangii]|uniref:cell division protein PerM n=1 Tax=Boudabousia liubingyangii TaxID=1921764 RepID=UPI000B2F7F4C|nr:DUF6350 family protein [Boudabousia liubingyangii]
MTQTGTQAQAAAPFHLPQGWSRVLLAGLEVVFLSWALSLAITFAGYLSQTSNRWLAETSWADVIGFGTSIWGASLFGAYPIADTAATLLPAGMTLVIILLAQMALKLRSDVHLAALLTFPLGFTFGALLLSMTAPSGIGIGRIFLGSLLVSGLSILWQGLRRLRKYRMDLDENLGYLNDDRVDDQLLNFLASGPRDLYRGLEIGWRVTLANLAIGLIALVAAVIVGFSRISEIAQALGAGTWEKILLVLAQLAYLPDLLAWSLSWIAGTGFYLGVDTWYGPGSYPPGPVPAIPVLGAIPASTESFWPAIWPFFLAWALLAVWRSERKLSQLRYTVPVAGAFIFLTTFLLIWTSQGALGPGRLTLVGPPVFRATFSIWFQSFGIYALIRLAFATEVKARFQVYTKSVSHRLSRVGSPAAHGVIGVLPSKPKPATVAPEAAVETATENEGN